MLVRREIVLIKPESSYNTDPTPVAADDAILVENPSWALEGATLTERRPVKPSLAPLQQVFGGTLRTITFDLPLRGPGAAYSSTVKPEAGVILRALGFAETIDTSVGTETATYVPASSSHESVTVYYHQDGQLVKLTGCRGTGSLSFEAGVPAKINVTLTGHSETPTDVALPTPTYDSTVPPPVLSGAFTIDGYSAAIAALNFDLGVEVAMPKDINASDGFGEIQIVGRNITGSFDPEAVLVATEAFEANFRNGASMALSLGTIGGTQYNQIDIDAPAAYYTEIAPGDRESIRTYDLSFALAESSTDDELSIVFS